MEISISASTLYLLIETMTANLIFVAMIVHVLCGCGDQEDGNGRALISSVAIAIANLFAIGVLVIHYII